MGGLVIIFAYLEFVVKPSFHLGPRIEWTGTIVCEEFTPTRTPSKRASCWNRNRLKLFYYHRCLTDHIVLLMFGKMFLAISKILALDIIHDQITSRPIVLEGVVYLE